MPTLIFAGENEYNELVTPDDSTYGGMWALVQYDYIPETTDKVYFESANQVIVQQHIQMERLQTMHYHGSNIIHQTLRTTVIH